MKSRKFPSLGFLTIFPVILGLLAPLCSTGEVSKEKDKVLWDYWYTITVEKGVPYGYYNERVVKRNGKYFFQTHVWKKEQEYINEEQLGAIAEDNADLTPVFYNFHSNYRATETKIDGTITDGKMLTVKIRKGEGERPVIKKSLPSRTFLSQFFPLWLGFRVPSFKIGDSLPFLTVMEDNIELEFATVHGRIRVEKPDEFANSSKALKIAVNYRDVKSTWWIERSGAAVKIEMPGTKTTVERVSKEKAERFLSK